MTRADLLEVIYRFYPRGLATGGLGYDDTEERQRQRDAARSGAAGRPTWTAMLRRLGARYEVASDGSLCLLAEWYTPAYSADIEIAGHMVGLHVSLLGPYYGIHRTGLPGEEPAALDLAREIEATYPGYEPIPPELGEEVVPDVDFDHRRFGKATIYDCLLSPEWYPLPKYTAADLEHDRALAARARPHPRRARSGLVATALRPTREPRDGEAGKLSEPHDDDAEHEAEMPTADDQDPAAGEHERRSGPPG